MIIPSPDVQTALREFIPKYAKDVRLSLESLLARPLLSDNETFGIVLAVAHAAKSPKLAEVVRASGRLDETHQLAAETASSLMAMSNAWYSYLDLASDPELVHQDLALRFTAYEKNAGVDKRTFEMYCLAASIVGRCRSCTAAHYQGLKEGGLGLPELREIGRLVSAASAAARVVDG